MPDEPAANTTTVTIPVRPGRYSYVRVRGDGSSSTVGVSARDRDAGFASVRVATGESIHEICLSSTSDPDFEPPRGVVWGDGAVL